MKRTIVLSMLLLISMFVRGQAQRQPGDPVVPILAGNGEKSDVDWQGDEITILGQLINGILENFEPSSLTEDISELAPDPKTVIGAGAALFSGDGTLKAKDLIFKSGEQLKKRQARSSGGQKIDYWFWLVYAVRTGKMLYEGHGLWESITYSEREDHTLFQDTWKHLDLPGELPDLQESFRYVSLIEQEYELLHRIVSEQSELFQEQEEQYLLGAADQALSWALARRQGGSS